MDRKLQSGVNLDDSRNSKAVNGKFTLIFFCIKGLRKNEDNQAERFNEI